ncbi:MAG: HEPN domain-containing protein [Bacteroidetes bacterium]|nr:HEPN domain-containing protein [Bacteroidota bacterium]
MLVSIANRQSKKYLKTFLVFKQIDFPRTHNLELLIQNCSLHQPAFEAIDLRNLEDFAVRGRYPHDFLMPELSETREFLQIAVEIKMLVRKEIGI